MAKILCTNCGTQYDDTDTRSSYFFASTTTYKRGSNASPSLIAAAVESIIYCPSCDANVPGPLKRTSESMGQGEPQLEARGKGERETASRGDADAVHPPE